jgi:hypothetical protein
LIIFLGFVPCFIEFFVCIFVESFTLNTPGDQGHLPELAAVGPFAFKDEAMHNCLLANRQSLARRTPGC